MEEGTHVFLLKWTTCTFTSVVPLHKIKFRHDFKKLINKHKYKHILFLYYIFKLFPFTCGRFTVLLSNKVNLNTTQPILQNSKQEF